MNLQTPHGRRAFSIYLSLAICSALLVMACSSCRSAKEGCPSHRNMSGYTNYKK